MSFRKKGLILGRRSSGSLCAPRKNPSPCSPRSVHRAPYSPSSTCRPANTSSPSNSAAKPSLWIPRIKPPSIGSSRPCAKPGRKKKSPNFSSVSLNSANKPRRKSANVTATNSSRTKLPQSSRKPLSILDPALLQCQENVYSTLPPARPALLTVLSREEKIPRHDRHQTQFCKSIPRHRSSFSGSPPPLGPRHGRTLCQAHGAPGTVRPPVQRPFHRYRRCRRPPRPHHLRR